MTVGEQVVQAAVVSAIAAEASYRLAAGEGALVVQGEEYVLASPLIAAVMVRANTDEAAVRAAIDAGVKDGVLRVQRDPDSGVVLGVRGDLL
jgi:hypothetical protein